MILRKGTLDDVDAIYNIIRQAQVYMKRNGINQWQNNYPNLDSIKEDIESGVNYVFSDGDKIIGTIAVLFDGEKTYDTIYEGEWLTDGRYAAIHRIAVEEKLKGLGIASKMLKDVEDLCLAKSFPSIKVDTHKDNLSMQKLLEKNGFIYCGIIYLEKGDERIAFEKKIN